MQKKIAEFLSVVFMPQLSSSYFFILLSLHTPTPLLFIFIAVLFSSAFPLLSLLYYVIVMKGDANVFDKENRTSLFLIAIISYLIGFILLRDLGAPFIFSALMLSYTLNTTVAALVTKYFTKVSVHVWGISGPSVAVFYYYGLLGLLTITIIAAIVGVARVQLRQHKTAQILLSFVLSIPVTFFIIYGLSPLII
jgi:hypothetical protein